MFWLYRGFLLSTSTSFFTCILPVPSFSANPALVISPGSVLYFRLSFPALLVSWTQTPGANQLPQLWITFRPHAVILFATWQYFPHSSFKPNPKIPTVTYNLLVLPTKCLSPRSFAFFTKDILLHILKHEMPQFRHLGLCWTTYQRSRRQLFLQMCSLKMVMLLYLFEEKAKQGLKLLSVILGFC